MNENRANLVEAATKHVREILAISVEHTAAHKVVLISDMQCELTQIVA